MHDRNAPCPSSADRVSRSRWYSLSAATSPRAATTECRWAGKGGIRAAAATSAPKGQATKAVSPHRNVAMCQSGWEQSQQVALLLGHFVASRKIAASSALLMHRMPRQ